MTWQDSLRQLDARLAKGEIGAAEYRRTRDEILAEASSSSQSVTFEPADDAGWQSANPAEEQDPDATVVTSVDTAPEHDAEATQVVSAADVAGPHPPPRFGPPGPLPQQQRPTPIQGQDVFTGTSSSGGGRVLRFLVPLLILALVGAGVWWFAFREPSTSPPASQDGGQQQERTTTTTPTTTSAPGVADVAERVPALPGQAKPESGTMTLAQARQRELLNPAYAKLLADGGAGEIVYRKSSGGGFGYLLVAAPVAKAGGAAALATATRDNLQKSGFEAVAGADGEPLVLGRADRFFRTYVTTYASGDVWVQINVSAPPEGDEAAVGTEFGKVLRSVLQELPAA
jgi:hypothetical protein